MVEERKQPGSMFASRLCERFCELYIPGWREMHPEDRVDAETRFLTTGQCCREEDLHPQSGKTRTILLFVEQGADAFQPFKRRVHSTWVQGLRWVARYSA
jgi:hypothetical protein